MEELVKSITPWIAVISVVVGAVLTLRNQLRLKAFELLLERRTAILSSVEERIDFYREVISELRSERAPTPSLDLFLRSDFHDSLMLLHRVKGVALGPLAGVLMDTYWSISMEATAGGVLSKSEAENLLQRKINALAAFYGFAHARISSEIEALTLSSRQKVMRAFAGEKKPRLP